jgi:2-polyprenyl-3-methyl-5-hydroxy-6-metoxy-1,4-benzoquinol methylase
VAEESPAHSGLIDSQPREPRHLENLTSWQDKFRLAIFHALSNASYVRPQRPFESAFERNYRYNQQAFERLGTRVEVMNMSVLDVGCGLGPACFYVAQRGARRVLGVDVHESKLRFAEHKLSQDYPELRNVMTFRQVGDALDEIKNERFDLILSIDAFEHYGSPAKVLDRMKACLSPGGLLVIVIAPLWKAPFGGHLGAMNRIPWIHLLFPQRIIMAERQRVWRRRLEAGVVPDLIADERDFRGVSLNKMTLRKFREILGQSGLLCVYFETNVSERRAMKAMSIMSLIPGCREFFTHNVYSVWRSPVLM